MIFYYEGIKKDGTRKNGQISANSESEAVDLIKSNGIMLISIDSVDSKKSLYSFNRIKKRDLAIFLKQLSTMLKSGLSILEALDIVRNQTTNNKLKNILKEVIIDLNKGSSFSDSISKHNDFPNLLVKMIMVGEESGNLENILFKLGRKYEKESFIEEKIKGALLYPKILMVVTLLITIFIFEFIMPIFIDLYTNSSKNLNKGIIFINKIYSIIKNKKIILLLLFSIIIYIINKIKNNYNIKYFFDKNKIKIPIINKYYINTYTHRFSGNLSSLLSSGLSLIESLVISKNTIGNLFYSDQINEISNEIKKGEELSSEIKERKIFNPILGEMIKVGEESGNLEEILIIVEEIIEFDLNLSIEKFLKLLEPIMILFISIIIGFIVISLISPMFDVVNFV